MRTKLYYVAHVAGDVDAWRVEGYASTFSSAALAVTWISNTAQAEWNTSGVPSKILVQDRTGLWSAAAEFPSPGVPRVGAG